MRSTPLLRLVIIAVVVAATALGMAPPADAQIVPSDIPITITTLPPSPTTAPTSTVPTANDIPGLFDVSGHVQQAINEWFASLVTSAINPALDLLGQTLLSAPDVTQQGEVRTVWLISMGIANAGFVLLALIGGITVMTHETVQTRYSVKEVAPRLVIGVVAANTSLLLASQAIQLSNGLAQAFLGEGIGPDEAVGGVGRAILDSAAVGGFFILLALAATIFTLILVCLYLVRAVLVVILVAGAPLLLACHALPQTDRIAALWWRAMAACLLIQVAQALVLVTAARVFFASDGAGLLGFTAGDGLVSLLITLCLLFIMVKIPGWAERLVFGGGGGPAKATGSKALVAARMAVARV